MGSGGSATDAWKPMCQFAASGKAAEVAENRRQATDSHALTHTHGIFVRESIVAKFPMTTPSLAGTLDVCMSALQCVVSRCVAPSCQHRGDVRCSPYFFTWLVSAVGVLFQYLPAKRLSAFRVPSVSSSSSAVVFIPGLTDGFFALPYTQLLAATGE